MRIIKGIPCLLMIFPFFFACSGQEENMAFKMADHRASGETRELYERLRVQADAKSFLFGSHDQTAYGINRDGSSWYDDGSGNRSDMKDVCGSHGAVFSWDVMSVLSNNPSSVETFRKRVLTAHNMGGVTTFCWHMRDPVGHSFYSKDIKKASSIVPSLLPGGEYHDWYRQQLGRVAQFFNELKDEEGKIVPVVFRPFHEHNGDWFWWGKGVCKAEDYIELWRFTVEYLRDSLEVHSFIYAFSPDGSRLKSKEDYLEIYPGDEYVDLFGFDYYFRRNNQAADFTRQMGWVIKLGEERDKAVALTETGNEKIEIENWFTSQLLKSLSDLGFRVAWVVTWRNAHPGHHYIPYPGHQEEEDFKLFYKHPASLFLSDIK